MIDVEIAPWNDISATAVWRPTTWTSPRAWRMWHGGPAGLHPLFWLSAVSVLTLCADIMHIIDLGVAHHIVGNVLWDFCYTARYFPGFRTAADRCDALWDMVAHQYRLRRSPCQLSNLQLSFFIDTGAVSTTFPYLSTRIKAAETRHLVPILHDIWRQLHDSASQYDLQVLECLRCLTDFYDVLSVHHEYALPVAVVNSLNASLQGVIGNYRMLSLWARAANVRRWHEVPKHHYVQHICMQMSATHQNPKYAWCYPDEDFMGLVKQISSRCMAGTPVTKLMSKVVLKWTLGVIFRMHRGERERTAAAAAARH